MITYQGKKVTATQAAKLIVADKVSMAEEYWFEDSSLILDPMESDIEQQLTKREIEQLNTAIEKQADRVYKLLGYWELREKVL